MQRNVVGWEPEMALFVPDDDPLRFYRPIARLASQRLTDGGRLYLEINPLCVDALQALLRDAGLTDIESHRDMTGRQRFITAQR
jgi:release factor glutamine methyltransferase